MSIIVELRRAGLDYAEVRELLEAVRAKHPSGGMQTASGCVCGQSCGGPAATFACSALQAIGFALKELRRQVAEGETKGRKAADEDWMQALRDVRDWRPPEWAESIDKATAAIERAVKLRRAAQEEP